MSGITWPASGPDWTTKTSGGSRAGTASGGIPPQTMIAPSVRSPTRGVSPARGAPSTVNGAS
ncbi:hypothetical protein [Arthrobacter agilis]|uniref:hypothetical protein n=1 Tax=Arthrobacter agilis TaxID=37921 RepID=UPI0027D7CBD0|nr:hypothetical protein [Arthrobacter agilis]